MVQDNLITNMESQVAVATPQGDRVEQFNSQDTSLAIIPAYNEERFIGSVVLKTLEYIDRVIVIDDGSTDATAHIAARAGAEVISHEINQGKGGALNTGFRLARERGPKAVVLIDADGQHLPEEIQKVLAPVLNGEADVVLGSRYIGEENETPSHRVWGHWVFNRITGYASGVSASDSQSGYRAFSKRAFQRISFSSSGFSVESEMQFLIREHHLRYVEVPITIRYTDKPKRNIVRHGLIVLNGILRFAGQYRPLMFIGLPGLLAMLAGAGMGVLVVNIYGRTQQLAVGYAMISVLLSIVGVVMLSTGIILHSMRGLILDLLGPRLNQASARKTNAEKGR